MAIVHCFGFSAENPRTFTILVSKSENPRGFSRNETIAETVASNFNKSNLNEKNKPDFIVFNTNHRFRTDRKRNR